MPFLIFLICGELLRFSAGITQIGITYTLDVPQSECPYGIKLDITGDTFSIPDKLSIIEGQDTILQTHWVGSSSYNGTQGHMVYTRDTSYVDLNYDPSNGRAVGSFEIHLRSTEPLTIVVHMNEIFTSEMYFEIECNNSLIEIYETVTDFVCVEPLTKLDTIYDPECEEHLIIDSVNVSSLPVIDTIRIVKGTSVFYRPDFTWINGSKNGRTIAGSFDRLLPGFNINDFGCRSEAGLYVDVYDYILPNAFSPNNDGNNDTYSTGHYMDIYDRFGGLVYNGYEWDGLNHPMGVYVALVHLDNQIIPTDVTLLR